MCFWNSLAVFDDLTDVCSLISGSSAFSKSSLNIWNFMVHLLLNPGLVNFEYYFARVWCCSLNVLWNFLSLGFEWKLTFSSPVTTAESSRFAGILSATLTESFRKRANSLCVKTHSVYTHSSMSDSGELIQNPLRTHPSCSLVFLSPGLKNSHEYFSPFYLQFSPKLVKCQNFSFVCLVLYISWGFVLGHFFLTELFHTSASNISNMRLINIKLTFSSIYA